MADKQELTILDLHDLKEVDIELVNRCYELWLETYDPILKSAGESVHADGFFRSRILMAVQEGAGREARLHGFCLVRTFDLRVATAKQSSYFDPVPVDVLKELSESGSRVFAVEWVTVHPSQRAKFSKVQMADLIMGLSTRMMVEAGFDLVMGYSRVDLGADRIAAKLGIRPLASVDVHGIECKVMVGRREWVGPHRFAVVAQAIETLWNSKQNRAQTFLVKDERESHEKKAA